MRRWRGRDRKRRRGGREGGREEEEKRIGKTAKDIRLSKLTSRYILQFFSR
jgi:hypothetical protein